MNVSSKTILDYLNIDMVQAFLANIPILNSLKTPEILWSFGVYSGYKMGILTSNGLMKIHPIADDSRNETSSFLSGLLSTISSKEQSFKTIL